MKTNNNGTPKIMKEALLNGLKDCQERGTTDQELMTHIIEIHVRDFLAQKFAVTMLAEDSPAVTSLWHRITTKVA